MEFPFKIPTPEGCLSSSIAHQGGRDPQRDLERASSSLKKSPQKVKFDETIYYKYIPNRKEKTTLSFASPSEFQKKLDNSKSVSKPQTSLHHNEFLKSLSSNLSSQKIHSISIKLHETSYCQSGQLDFDIVRKLGEGSYGLVVEVEPISKIPDHFPKSKTYILKIIKDISKSKAFEDEQRIMMEIKNKNKNCFLHVMNYFYIVSDSDNQLIYFLSEKFDGNVYEIQSGSYPRLDEMGNGHINTIDEPTRRMDLALETFDQILQGLDELKDINLLHRNLKPENILYKIPEDQRRKKEQLIQLKLSDFGLSPMIDYLSKGQTSSLPLENDSSHKLPFGKDWTHEKHIITSQSYIDPIIYKYIFLSSLNKSYDKISYTKIPKDILLRDIDIPIVDDGYDVDSMWSETNDIYSLAVILYEILFGRYLSEGVYEKLYPLWKRFVDDDKKLRMVISEKERKELVMNIENNFLEFEKLYEELYLEKLSKIIKENNKYIYGSRESNILTFLIRNLIPFDTKLTIDNSKPYLRNGVIQDGYEKSRRQRRVKL